MPHRDIVVIGASVGGVEAYQVLLSRLPKNLRASIFIVLHLAPESHSLLPDILNRAGEWRAMHPRDGDPLRHGIVYVAPPDNHMMLSPHGIRLVKGPKENRHRPAIDPLFRSAAAYYGERVIGVILTGALDDGSAGLLAVSRRGGVTIVQDPDQAFCPDMPRSAMRYVNVDHVLRLEQIPEKLAELTVERAESIGGPDKRLRFEVKAAEANMSSGNGEENPGNPSPYTCPECNGVLWETSESGLMRFRCRVGHAYTAANLQTEQNLMVESSIWAALRALEESASLARRMAERSEGRHSEVTRRYQAMAESKEHHAEVLRNLLLERDTKAEDKLVS